MARLSDATYQEGLGLARARNLRGLLAWCRTHTPHVDPAVVEQAFQNTFAQGDTMGVIRTFDHIFKGYDPTVETLRLGLRLLLYGIVALGILGGLIYLIRVIVA